MDLQKLKCVRCGHEWFPRRNKLPLVCPECGSAGWRGEAVDQQQRNELAIDRYGETQKEENNAVLFRAKHALGEYDYGIEEVMRFIAEFLPNLSIEEEKLIKRLMQSLRLNIEITIRGEARDSQQENQQDNSHYQQQPTADDKMQEAEEIARAHRAGEADFKGSRKRAR